jgi:hypothetical protein
MARLKPDKRRTASSRAWLERQINDPYVARAKREGFRSRAAYKLAEIDDKFRLLKPGARVSISAPRRAAGVKSPHAVWARAAAWWRSTFST